ncbi:hypothetical protein COCVIDRAFT_115438 [Bipolaris victoriae FI3]|uniref:Uncharacterized protein n=1 Tax=Bipolaris victoriae (strain FI3) TaxID=930091 RepID=W7E1F7_BIPV3|nr:hypothetical protein COCVIDRAFT_115438 [Bipolaris victoriae FI3]
MEKLLADLNTIQSCIWTVSATKTDFEAIRRKLQQLNCELQVHETLADTTRWLHETDRLNARYRTRVEKMVTMVHGDEKNPGVRFEMLRSLEMKAFMFVSASYTVLDIRKMSQDVFACLMEMAPKYIDTITLPTGWMHRTELRAAVAGYAKSGTAFKRSIQYHPNKYQVDSHLF